MSNRKFFFMVAAEVLFQMPADNDQVSINTVKLNGMVTHDKDTFPTTMLGQAQKIVQMQLFKKLGDDATKCTVVDVTILNIMNLGYMTEDEFYAPPAGQKQQERTFDKAGLKVVSKAPESVQ